MTEPAAKSARWSTETGTQLRRRQNRKLRQRRALRAWLEPPDLRRVGAGAWRGVRKLAPILAALALLVAASASVMLGWHWATHSPRFEIREIAVSGHTRVTHAQILEATGLAEGQNLLSVSTEAAEAALEQLPWIERASVARHLPGSLTIELHERKAAAVAVLDAPYLVDESGRPFKRAALERGEADGLVVITGLTRDRYLADAVIGEATLRLALGVLAHYRKNPERPPVGEVNLSHRGIRLYTVAGAVALELGRTPASELDARLERFDVIWAALSSEERATARTIHLDSATRPDRVTVELADAR